MGHDVIGYDPGLGAVPAAAWIEQRAAGATIVLRSREVTDRISAAASGLGLAVVPCLLGDAEPALRRITRQVVATRRWSLVYRRERWLSENVHAVVRFVTQVVLAHADEVSGASRA